MFWIIIALLTAAVALVLTYPLMRSKGIADTAREGEVAVYRDGGETNKELPICSRLEQTSQF